MRSGIILFAGHQVVVNNGTFSWDKKTEPVLKELVALQNFCL